MQGLYPIIQRKRRPLIVQDAPPVAAGNVEPANTEAKVAVGEDGTFSETPGARCPEGED